MDSTYNENEYMPNQTGEESPLPEPEEPRRVIISKETQPIGQKKKTEDINKPKRPVRRIAAPPKPSTSHRGAGRRSSKPIEKKSKLTVLLDPEMLTKFKIQALMQGVTYSQLATEAFTSLLIRNETRQATPKKKVIRSSSTPTQEGDQ